MYKNCKNSNLFHLIANNKKFSFFVHICRFFKEPGLFLYTIIKLNVWIDATSDARRIPCQDTHNSGTP